MTELLIGQCARCGGNLAACVRGCRWEESERIMTEETKDWRAEMPTGIAMDGPFIIRGRFVSEHSAEALVTRANAELDALRAQLAERDARIRELTEWRPMSEAPRDGRDILARIPGGYDVVGWTGTAWTDGSQDYFQDSHFLGWLPLPKAKQ